MLGYGNNSSISNEVDNDGLMFNINIISQHNMCIEKKRIKVTYLK